MKLQAFIEEVTSSERVSLLDIAGVINIESAFAEVKGEYFGECECSRSGAMVVSCASCGREPGNHVRLLAGRGDGVYGGVTFTGADGIKPLVTLIVFDEDNRFATHVNNVIERVAESDLAELLGDALAPYMESPLFEIATVTGGSRGLLMGDAVAGIHSPFAVFSHFGTGGVSYRVLAAFEDSGTAENDVQSWRPRVLAIVDEALEISPQLSTSAVAHDWSAQGFAWRNSLVSSNLIAGNEAVAAYFNGVLWRNRQADLHAGGDFNDDYFSAVGIVAFGWFSLGALWGDQDCGQYLTHMIHESDGFFDDAETIGEGLWFRGWDLTPSIAAVISEAGATRCSWCEG